MKVIDIRIIKGCNLCHADDFNHRACTKTMSLLKIVEKRNVMLLVHTQTSLVAFFYGFEVVGIPKAATIK